EIQRSKEDGHECRRSGNLLLSCQSSVSAGKSSPQGECEQHRCWPLPESSQVRAGFQFQNHLIDRSKRKLRPRSSAVLPGIPRERASPQFRPPFPDDLLSRLWQREEVRFCHRGCALPAGRPPDRDRTKAGEPPKKRAKRPESKELRNLRGYL